MIIIPFPSPVSHAKLTPGWFARTITFSIFLLVLLASGRGLAAQPSEWYELGPVVDSAGPQMNSVAASDTMIVAVGESGAIRISRDGVNWETPLSPSDGPLLEDTDINDVVWTGAVFLAGTADGRILRSRTGRDWDYVMSNTGPAIARIVLGSYNWGIGAMAVGQNGRWINLIQSGGVVNEGSVGSGDLWDATQLGLGEWLLVGDDIILWIDTYSYRTLADAEWDGGEPAFPIKSVVSHDGVSYILDSGGALWKLLSLDPAAWQSVQQISDGDTRLRQPPGDNRVYMLRDAFSYDIESFNIPYNGIVWEHIYTGGQPLARDMARFGDAMVLLAHEGGSSTLYRKGPDALIWSPAVLEFESQDHETPLTATWTGVYTPESGYPHWPHVVEFDNLPDDWDVDEISHGDTRSDWSLTAGTSGFQQLFWKTVAPAYGSIVAGQFARNPVCVVHWRPWDESSYLSPFGPYPQHFVVIRGSGNSFVALDPSDGKLWQSADGVYWLQVYPAFSLNNARLFSNRHGFWLMPNDGTPLQFSENGTDWQMFGDSSITGVSTVYAEYGLLWIGTGSGQVYRYDIDSGLLDFITSRSGPVWSFGRINDSIHALIGFRVYPLDQIQNHFQLPSQLPGAMIVHGDGIWLGVTQSDELFYSLDLRIWCPVPNFPSQWGELTSIHHTGTVFLATTDNGYLLSSVNGWDWTERLESSSSLSMSANNEDILLVLGTDGEIRRQAAQAPPLPLQSPTSGLLITSDQPTSEPIVFLLAGMMNGFNIGTLTEGEDYTVADLPEGFELMVMGLSDGSLSIQVVVSDPVAVGKTVFLQNIGLTMLPGSYFGDPTLLEQINETPLSLSILGEFYHDTLVAGDYDINGKRAWVSANGIILLLDDSDSLYRSEDGYDWYPVNHTGAFSQEYIEALHVVDGVFWAVTGGQYHWRSQDGWHWSGPHTVPDYTGNTMAYMAEHGEILAVVDSNDALYVRVPDEAPGQSVWHTIYDLGLSSVLDLMANDTGFAVLGFQVLATSLDGLDWVSLDLDGYPEAVALESHNGQWWVLFDNGSLISVDPLLPTLVKNYPVPVPFGHSASARDLVAIGGNLVMSSTSSETPLLVSSNGVDWQAWTGSYTSESSPSSPRLLRLDDPASGQDKLVYSPGSGAIFVAGGDAPQPRVLWTSTHFHFNQQYSNTATIGGRVSRLVDPGFSGGNIEYYDPASGEPLPEYADGPYLTQALPEGMTLSLQFTQTRRFELSLYSDSQNFRLYPNRADIGLRFPTGAFIDVQTSEPIDSEAFYVPGVSLSFEYEMSPVRKNTNWGAGLSSYNFEALHAYPRSGKPDLVLGLYNGNLYVSENGYNWNRALVDQNNSIAINSLAVGVDGAVASINGSALFYTQDGYYWEYLDSEIRRIDPWTGELEEWPSDAFSSANPVAYADGLYYAIVGQSLLCISEADLFAPPDLENPSRPVWHELVDFHMWSQDQSLNHGSVQQIYGKAGWSGQVIMLMQWSNEAKMLGIWKDDVLDLLPFDEVFGAYNQPGSGHDLFIREVNDRLFIGGGGGDLWMSQNGRHWVRVLDNATDIRGDGVIMYAIASGALYWSHDGYHWQLYGGNFSGNFQQLVAHDNGFSVLRDWELLALGPLHAYAYVPTIISLPNESHPARINLLGGEWGWVDFDYFRDSLYTWHWDMWSWQQAGNGYPWDDPWAEWQDEDSWFENQYFYNSEGYYSGFNRHVLPSGAYLKADGIDWQNNSLLLEIEFRSELSDTQDPQQGPVFEGLGIFERRDNLGVQLGYSAVQGLNSHVPTMDNVSIGLLHIGESPRSGDAFSRYVDINRMVYGAGRFVYQDEYDGIFASDGQRWIPVLTVGDTGSSDLRNLTWHPQAGVFSVISGTQFWTSVDGISWIPRDPLYPAGYVFWQGELLAVYANRAYQWDEQVGWDDTFLGWDDTIMGWTDTYLKWSGISMDYHFGWNPSADFSEIHNANDEILVAWDRNQQAIFTSLDGVSWVQRTPQLSYLSAMPGRDDPTIVEAEDGWYAFFSDGVLFSPDGEQWSQHRASDTMALGYLTEVLRLPGVWLLTDGYQIGLSRDLIEFIPFDNVPSSQIPDIRALAWNGMEWLGFGWGRPWRDPLVCRCVGR